MDHYLDLMILPDPEFPSTVLMNALFAKCHLALVEVGDGAIGVSFPRADKNLGDCLRLHGAREKLITIQQHRWLQCMRDHTVANEVRTVPANCSYRIVRRVQPKSSAERLRRRSIRKGWLGPEEAERQISLEKEQRVKLPFLQLKSGSSGRSFRLFIDQTKVASGPRAGEFSSYGLSTTASIPWF